MKKVLLVATLLGGVSFSSLAATTPHTEPNATKSPNQAFVLSKDLIAKKMLYEYAYGADEMCGRSGKATGNSWDEVVELLNMLHDQYCG
ncbi:hypothetical protein ACFPAF_14830 [Hymenobacter endophyticus]|uniref:Uncharacterized protein n=1 Tax=Hymenobacter endophyticus TaxID=3076335 RepID=A0ABU3TJY4_9BACT|nr:hypothetical protein [Hymenobacter endophyticus]MDU0371677.1 hypothetical protein [Hymenobacter endophyticus]